MQFFLSAENVLRAQHMYALMKRSSHVLVVSHRKPDGDTLASALVCYDFLQRLGATVVLFCVDQIPPVFEYLPHVELFKHSVDAINERLFDLIVVVDSGDLAHTGIEDQIKTLRSRGSKCISIDHHATHSGFGDINLVDESASSTGEVLFSFLQINHLPLNRDLALLLLTGLITDTYTFSNPATNYVATSVASYLVNTGIPLHSLVQQIRRDITIETLNIWGEIMSGLIFNEKLGSITAIIDQSLLTRHGVDSKAADGFANFLGHYCEAAFILVLRDLGNGCVKGSLRTSHDHVDVARIAQALGGGGHRKAAGFTIQGGLVKHRDTWRIATK